MSKFEREFLEPASVMLQLVRGVPGRPADLGTGSTCYDAAFVSGALTLYGGAAGSTGSSSLLSHAMVRWAAGGMPRFRLSHGLIAQLALTDPNGVSWDSVRLPFSTFLIELPTPNGPLAFDSHEGELIEGAYLVVHQYQQPAEDPEAPDVAPTSWVREVATAKKNAPELLETLFVAARGHRFSGPFIHSILRMQQDVKIGAGGSDGGNQDVTARDDSCIVLACRVAIGLALYLDYVASPPRVASHVSRTVRHEGGLCSQLIEIGGDIDIDRRLRGAARDACLAGVRPEGWKYSKRFVVRGHWKQQACGPGRSERRLIFVQPYWKGADDAPLLVRAYTDEPE